MVGLNEWNKVHSPIEANSLTKRRQIYSQVALLRKVECSTAQGWSFEKAALRDFVEKMFAKVWLQEVYETR